MPANPESATWSVQLRTVPVPELVRAAAGPAATGPPLALRCRRRSLADRLVLPRRVGARLSRVLRPEPRSCSAGRMPGTNEGGHLDGELVVGSVSGGSQRMNESSTLAIQPGLGSDVLLRHQLIKYTVALRSAQLRTARP